MKKLENERFEAVGVPSHQRVHSFIIPIIFRGPERMPQELAKKGRIYYDFSKYTLVEPGIGNNSKYVGIIQKIAERIYHLYEEFSQIADLHDCENFTFPSETEALKWLETIEISGELNISNPRFPGRQEGR